MVATAVLLPLGTAVAAGVIHRHRVRPAGGRAGRRARQRSEAVALRDALDVLVGELRVGAHPVVAFESGRTGKSTVGWPTLCTAWPRARQLGADVAAGLREVAGQACTLPGARSASRCAGSWPRLTAWPSPR